MNVYMYSAFMFAYTRMYDTYVYKRTQTCIHEQKVLENYDGETMAEIAKLYTKHTAELNPKGYPKLNTIQGGDSQAIHQAHSRTKP